LDTFMFEFDIQGLEDGVKHRLRCRHLLSDPEEDGKQPWSLVGDVVPCCALMGCLQSHGVLSSKYGDFLFLIHRSHSISFTRAQGIPKFKIGLLAPCWYSHSTLGDGDGVLHRSPRRRRGAP
jgi:hypothetical protein